MSCRLLIIPTLITPHSATFEHEQFWVDRDSNQVEGRFTYATPEGRELETRYGMTDVIRTVWCPFDTFATDQMARSAGLCNNVTNHGQIAILII